MVSFFPFVDLGLRGRLGGPGFPDLVDGLVIFPEFGTIHRAHGGLGHQLQGRLSDKAAPAGPGASRRLINIPQGFFGQ
jgi:hypothetical protein